jgi:hypothetical protein
MPPAVPVNSAFSLATGEPPLMDVLALMLVLVARLLTVVVAAWV